MFSATCDPTGLRLQPAVPARGPVAADHDQLLARLRHLKDDLEDIARLVAQMHDVRVLLDDCELAMIESKRHVDTAPSRSSRTDPSPPSVASPPSRQATPRTPRPPPPPPPQAAPDRARREAR